MHEMNTKTQTMQLTASPELNKKSYDILIKRQGDYQATRFVVALECGEGDAVVDVKKYWGDASVDEIHRQIMEAKERGEL